LPPKHRGQGRFSPEYLAVASDRDFWYGLVILGVILSMLVLALAYAFQPAVALELATIPFVIYAITRFAALDQR
jgi:hypothetical protein